MTSKVYALFRVYRERDADLSLCSVDPCYCVQVKMA